MQAICIHGYGGPEVLAHRDVPRPTPSSGEVLVRIYAAGVNPVDWKIREGLSRDSLQYRFPLVPRRDLSGAVEETGSGVTASTRAMKPSPAWISHASRPGAEHERSCSWKDCAEH